tara:strand:- start:3694 stop:7419 length:3726 start_codon:yes stop_codon:yes gene_type:complete
MSGITQTIPNYVSGISEQPDALKLPGQLKDIQNAIPHPIYGLHKRPGSKRLGVSPLTNVQSGGSFFHYHRDETEGSYIGQVAADGRVRMWSCTDGAEKNVWYVTDNTAYNGSTSTHTSITSYLTPTPSTDVEDIQALTINDTTFLVNRSKTVASTGTTDSYPHKNFAFINLLRSENGRQYALNLYRAGTTSDITVATKLKVDSDTLYEGTGSASCPGIGTQVFDISEPVTAISITNGGSGYSSAPTVSFSGGGGSGASAVATIDSGAVDSITITHCGTGYTSAPTISFSGGGGSSAAATATVSPDKNLVFRLDTTGQQGVRDGSTTNLTGAQYKCSYRREIVLLHGGEGWAAGDKVTVLMDSASASTDGLPTGEAGPYSYTVEVEKTETVSVKADIKAIRPSPTPFDADTAVTPDSILGSIQSELSGLKSSYTIATSDVTTGSETITITNHGLETGAALVYGSEGGTALAGLTNSTTYYVIKVDDNTIKLATSSGNATAGTAIDLTGTGNNSQTLSAAISSSVIGNGLYLSCEAPFNVEVVDRDLMEIMQSEINDVTGLPIQCKHGYIVKIANTRMSDEDDYYVKFIGENNLDGNGSWRECAAPDIVKSFDASTLPHILQRQADGDFLIKEYEWEDRVVGDNTTNPIPTFVGQTINKVVFFRNRLVFLSGENVVMSRPGTIDKPDFWSASALTVGATDPIDIACASTYPSELFDAIEITTGLLCFSTNRQFLLSADDTVLNPDTAKLRAVTNRNYNKVLHPIDMGPLIAWVDNTNKYSAFLGIADVAREGEPTVNDLSLLVPSLLPKNLDLIANSIENKLVFLGKSTTDTIYGLKYTLSQEGSIYAWFKWKFNNPLKYHFCINDQYYILDTDNFLQTIQLVQDDNDISIDQDSINYLGHLDNWTTVYGGVYDASTQLTTFTDGTNGCEITWQSSVTTPNGSLVVYDSNSNSSRVGRYATATVTSAGSTFTLPGDWSPEVRSVTITNGGSGYTSAPTVSIKGNKGAWTASTAYVTGDQVTNNDRLYILTSGNHTSSSSGAPTHSSGTVTTGGGDWLFSGPQATGTATVVDGAVTAVTITDAGYNYHSGATVTFDGGGGSGATATATVSPLSTSQLNIGYLYEYSVSFPRIYFGQPVSEGWRSDVNASLVIHRLKFNFGKIGLYSTKLIRVGKDDYTETYESSTLNEYSVSDAPLLEKEIKTVAVYDKNENVDIQLTSTHPAPATLHSLTWEGDYSTLNYRRA